jgi:hypothetical protein
VEWLVNQLRERGYAGELPPHLLFYQAKAIEREQIEDAYKIGYADAWDDARYDDEPIYATSEQYYNKTYGNE